MQRDERLGKDPLHPISASPIIVASRDLTHLCKSVRHILAVRYFQAGVLYPSIWLSVTCFTLKVELHLLTSSQFHLPPFGVT
jgi:hypothetical protein